MLTRIAVFIVPSLLTASSLGADDVEAYLQAKDAGADFHVQGEYTGLMDNEKKMGVQVIALGDGTFQATVYHGGLPGDGWEPATGTISAEGKLSGDTVILKSALGEGRIQDGVLKVSDTNGVARGQLKRIVRKSPTLGQSPPPDAEVLFDGTSADQWINGRLSEDGLLQEGMTSKSTFGDFQLHLEFQLSFMPQGRGQRRSNSGVYIQGRHEVQILDSFGLSGEHDECGGIYSVAKPRINMCFPPLSWQTYDVDFTAARFENGKKTDNARMTVRHNGVLVHENVEVDHATTAAPLEEGPQPGPIYVQDHGDPLRFRNIWVVRKTGN